MSRVSSARVAKTVGSTRLGQRHVAVGGDAVGALVEDHLVGEHDAVALEDDDVAARRDGAALAVVDELVGVDDDGPAVGRERRLPTCASAARSAPRPAR